MQPNDDRGTEMSTGGPFLKPDGDGQVWFQPHTGPIRPAEIMKGRRRHFETGHVLCQPFPVVPCETGSGLTDKRQLAVIVGQTEVNRPPRPVGVAQKTANTGIDFLPMFHFIPISVGLARRIPAFYTFGHNAFKAPPFGLPEQTESVRKTFH